ncbi:UNVERIFIED_CONTAM: hypothetical protein FKN15_000372 [Acipenser sinensis]
MTQILEHLSRQQVAPAPAPATPAPAPEHTPDSPVVAAEVEQQDVVMSEEEQDVRSLAASWDEESFLQTETQDPDLTQRVRGVLASGCDAPLPYLGTGKGKAMASSSYHGNLDYPDHYGTTG